MNRELPSLSAEDIREGIGSPYSQNAVAALRALRGPSFDIERASFFFVNGIRTSLADRKPDDPKLAWNAKADEWCEERRIHAHTYRYFTLAITRFIEERERAEIMAAKIDDCRGMPAWPVRYKIAVGHSNGADVIVKAARLCQAPIDELWLIAGACDERFDANGLNKLLRSRKVGRVFVWASKYDSVLGTAGSWSSILRPIGLGYGTLGLIGPQHVDTDVRDRVFVRWCEGFSHSTYFDQGNFEATMRRITGVSA